MTATFVEKSASYTGGDIHVYVYIYIYGMDYIDQWDHMECEEDKII